MGGNSALNELMAVGIVAWILWELWNDDGDSNTVSSNVMVPNDPGVGNNGGSNNGGSNNGGNNDMPAPIPTPALLPGLIGMGMAAIRKRNAAQAEQA